MRRRPGFTFIEIILVILVIGMLTAIALPRFKGTSAVFRLRQAARDVTGLLRYARNTAVLRELASEVRFDPDRDAYQLVLLDKDGERVDEPRRRRRSRRDSEPLPFTAGDEVAGVRRLPEGVHFAAIYTGAPLTEDTDLPRIIYYPDGSATPATVAIQDDKGLAISVEIYQTTGMARVEKGLPVEEPKAKTLYYGPKKK